MKTRLIARAVLWLSILLAGSTLALVLGAKPHNVLLGAVGILLFICLALFVHARQLIAIEPFEEPRESWARSVPVPFPSRIDPDEPLIVVRKDGPSTVHGWIVVSVSASGEPEATMLELRKQWPYFPRHARKLDSFVALRDEIESLDWRMVQQGQYARSVWRDRFGRYFGDFESSLPEVVADLGPLLNARPR